MARVSSTVSQAIAGARTSWPRAAACIGRLLRTGNAVFAGMGRCKRGVSAVEFALIAPVLILLLFAAVDYGRVFIASYRAGFVADTIAELVSQTKSTPLADGDIAAFMQAAPLIDPDILAWGRQTGNTNLASLSAITISSIAMTKSNASCTSACTYTAAVVFSRTLSGSVRPCGQQTAAADGAATSTTTLPNSIFGPVDMIVVDVSVYFKPLLLSPSLVPSQFNRSAYFRPRTLARVNSQNNCSGF